MINNLRDILLNRPLSDSVNRALLFGIFSLHFLFVLLTIGTAILAVYYFTRGRWIRGGADSTWGKQILETFTAHKSLAVVLGVGALLLMQVGFTVQFFTAVRLFASYWLLIILFLILSFLALDGLAHGWGGLRNLAPVWGIVGLTFLLAVPGIFVLVLVTTGNAAQWAQIASNGTSLKGSLAFHWLVRYLHVIGASVVFAGVFHYFLSKAEERERRQTMLRWAMAGLLFQIVDGVLLLYSVPRQLPPITVGVLVVGILSAMALAWRVFTHQALGYKYAVVNLLFILLPMLMTRQLIQEQSVLPVNRALAEQAAAYEAVLAPLRNDGLKQYREHLNVVYDNGQTIFGGSCGFCHGPGGAGDGQEASTLRIPPEVLSQVRATPSYLQQQMTSGVPRTGMPFFTFYTRDKLFAVIEYMGASWGVLSRPEPVAAPVSEADATAARNTFTDVCSACHGTDGTGSTFLVSRLTPRPPNFTEFNLTPRRAFDVISNGYPGTDMVAFGSLSEGQRWGLVQIVQGFFRQ